MMYGLKEGEAYKPWLWPVPTNASCIGKKDLGRRDGYVKASGRTLFTRDVFRPGMLYTKALLSPYPHARIKSMDTSAAEKMPGVTAVLRYDDPDIEWGTVTVPRSIPWKFKLIGDEARWYNQPIGVMIIAESELIVDEALRSVVIDWEVLPFLIDWNKSLDPSTPILFPDVNPDNNVRRELVESHGDIEKGLEEADKVIDVEFNVEVDTWAGVAGNCNIADFKGEKVIELWIETQAWTPFSFTSAEVLAIKKWLPENILVARAHTPHLAGRFGQGFQYEACFPNYAITAANKVSRPVKFLFDGSTFAGSGEHAGTYKLTLGFKDNGEITAIKYHTIEASSVQDQMTKILEGTKIENVHCTKTYSLNNRGYYTCYKHGDAAHSCHAEVTAQVAAALGMDPAEVDIINDGSEGASMTWIDANVKAQQGFDPKRDSLKEVITIGKKAIGWDEKWHQPGTKILPNGKYHGIGYVSEIAWTHTPNLISRGTFGLKVMPDGTVSLMSQDGDPGVNRETTYCQVIADELGMRFDDVHSQIHEFCGFEPVLPAASAGLTGNLPSLVRVARKMKAMLLSYAIIQRPGGWGPPQPALFPDKKVEELDIKDSMIYEIAKPENKAPVAAVAASFNFNLFTWDYPPSELTDIKTMYVMARQCYFMEVEVDPDTGWVDVKKVVVVNDVGRAINPDVLEGQQYGGTYMGLGRSRQEQVIWDPQQGVKLNDNLIGYPICLMNDCGSIEGYLVESGFGYSAYGTYGIGESGAACTSSLTRYAVHNAIGKWVDLKTTPDKVLRALGKV